MTYPISITPRAERMAVIRERYETSNELGEPIYEFRGGVHKPKVISLPVHLPVYRMENCRAFSAQQTEIARKGFDKNFFAKGQEVASAQAAQHKILAELARRGTESVTPIFDVLQKEGQRETILISSSGVVVNGNRRLSAMRELLLQRDGSVDQRFEHVRCAVLPPDTARDEIDDIEADLQARPETKLEYDWIGDARLIRRQVDKGRSTRQVADRLHRSRSEIENVLQALDEADLYLSEWLDKPGEYALVQEGEQIFADIPKNISRQGSKLKDASRALAWSIYDNRKRITGRVYRLNRAFGDLAPRTLELLENRLGLASGGDEEQSPPIDSIDDDDFAVDIENPEEGPDYSGIIQALRNDDEIDQKVDALVDACETAIELDKGQKNEEAALKALVQVNSRVVAIDVMMAGRETLPGILKQIQSIRSGLQKLEAGVKDRLKKGHDGSVNMGLDP